MPINQCLIFPHIPKCGGTSLKKQFENSNLKVYFDYEFPPHNSKKYFNDLCQRRNKEASLLDFGSFDIVFGHFPLERYKRKNYQYIILLRHPLERAMSQYFYWKNLLPVTNIIAIGREPVIKEIKNGSVQFLDFLKLQNMDSFYSNYLNNFKPHDFMLVGFMDNYRSFLIRLSKHLEINLDNNIHERKGINEGISQKEIREAEMLLAPEIKRYIEFRELWKE